jgi:predicted Zn-dependent protease
MSPEEESRRRELQRGIANSTTYVSNNVWHNPEGGQFSNHYKILARTFMREGVEGVEKAIREALDRRRQAFPQGKTLSQLFELADQFQQEGKQIEAMDIYAAIRMADPRNAEANMRFAMLVNAMGISAFAIKLMAQAVEREPASPLYRAQLGDLLLQAGRYADAEAALRSSLVLNPNDAKVQSSLAIALEKQGATGG